MEGRENVSARHSDSSSQPEIIDFGSEGSYESPVSHRRRRNRRRGLWSSSSSSEPEDDDGEIPINVAGIWGDIVRNYHLTDSSEDER